MQVHSSATTNKKQRQRLQEQRRQGNPKTCRALAQELAVSVATVHRWKQRETPDERSCRPKTVQYAFAPEQQTVILSLRQQGLALDELVDAAQQVIPGATRASIYRLLVRHGKSRLPTPTSPAAGQLETGQPATGAGEKYGQFKEYGPGFVHMDCFYLPTLAGQKRYCFVAIDRATRLSFLAVYEHKDKEAATDFLTQCLAFFPFKITKLLTDNGREFTLSGFKNRYGTRCKTVHPVDAVCGQEGIEHRLTRPYTPKTNGLVERMNGLTKEATTKAHHYENAQQMQADLTGWFVRYNFCRQHRRIGNKTPYEAASDWYAKDKTLFTKEPAVLLAYRSQSCET